MSLQNLNTLSAIMGVGKQGYNVLVQQAMQLCGMLFPGSVGARQGANPQGQPQFTMQVGAAPTPAQVAATVSLFATAGVNGARLLSWLAARVAAISSYETDMSITPPVRPWGTNGLPAGWTVATAADGTVTPSYAAPVVAAPVAATTTTVPAS